MPPSPSFPLPQGVDRILFDAETIARRVGELGAAITGDFLGKPLTVVAILQGGALFMADLIRRIHLPLQI
ncbi:MAG: hypoxanthine phosphoribosyltransferase, partial [Verrucomicrobiae bacterium]|nr:hypoxanthine phosphoribosyltransferase [Verrucomicrobiae bacterium]